MTTNANIVKRYPQNPILTKDDVPYPVATIHNAGVVKHKDRYIMLFRSHLKKVPGPVPPAVWVLTRTSIELAAPTALPER